MTLKRQYTYVVWLKNELVPNTLILHTVKATTANKAVAKASDHYSFNWKYYGCMTEREYYKLLSKHCRDGGWLPGYIIKENSKDIG